MQAEIISIGNELLSGHTVNSNAAWLASLLNDAGIEVRQITVVGDGHDEILRALEEAGRRVSLVITTGGLGPTRDDLTKEAICAYFHTRLILDERIVEDNRAFFEKRGLPLTELNRLQALIPEKATPLRNPYGTAAGLWIADRGIRFAALPGVPHEMKHLVRESLLPKLKNLGKQHMLHQTIYTQGVGESFLSEMISDWEKQLPPFIHLAYLPSPGVVKLRLSARGKNKQILKRSLTREVGRLKRIIPQHIGGGGDRPLEEAILEAFRATGKTLATAESCTGGYLAHRLTSVPGSSAYFKGSVVPYDNQAKSELLGVAPATLQEYGAVSREVVMEMAAGCRKKFLSTHAVAISGIAGPSGGSEEKPVGLVWIAVAGPHDTLAQKHRFGDRRDRNIIRASIAAMDMLIQMISHPAKHKHHDHQVQDQNPD